MSHYLLQVAYTAAAAKAMVDSPQNREDVARKAIESLGGRLNSFHFCFGPFDAVLIIEMPDNVSAAALALAVSAAGGVSRFVTTPLMATADGVAAMQKAKTAVYMAPA